jgi:RNA polymerase sigma-70 factor (ECF subfamily)
MLGPNGAYEPFALVIIEVSGGWITETATYLDSALLFPLFDLPTGSRSPALNPARRS